jgi:hypothetical protein
MPNPKIVNRTERRGEFLGNRKRLAPEAPVPKLEFGPHGELTYDTIREAKSKGLLSKEEEKLAREMVKVHHAYLDILDCLSYPIDPEGHVHDLSAIGATRLAIAWTLALNGCRFTGKKYIKKHHINAAGCYSNAHTWVDARTPENAPAEALFKHRSDVAPPPATQRLDPNVPMPEMWHVKPRITYDEGMGP